MKIGLRHIRYFLVLAEDLNFRRASEHLHISQPALTRTIQHLEAELQVTLFDRSQNRQHRPSAGLADIADVEPVPARLLCGVAG